MIAEVIVDILNAEVDRVFDYYASDDIEAGHRVLVPFGPRKVEGYVIRLKEASDILNLKPIINKLDNYPVITAEMLELMSFMVKKYHIRKADALRLFIPGKLRGGRVKELTKRYVSLMSGIVPEEAILSCRKGADKQIALINALANTEAMEHAEAADRFGAAAVKALADRKIILIKQSAVNRTPYSGQVSATSAFEPTPEQKQAVEMLKTQGKYLLHGVTGSGKTEVYMQAISYYVEQGKTAMMLVPEISLTPQILRLFRGRFGAAVALLHSGISDGERFDEWRRILTGEAKIVVGARSAVFAPVRNIGIIIIDEEHDHSYISENNPRYRTEEIANERARYNKALLVLGSATPSVETFEKAKRGALTLIKMPSRINGRDLPEMEIVDMCEELRAGNKDIFSRRLKDALSGCIEAGNQAMLFINRRGHSSFVMCRECGTAAKCSDCDVSLTYHSTENRLKCHYCGKQFKMLTRCEACGSDKIRLGRTGTEKVIDELRKLFPGVQTLRMDNDTVKGKDAHNKILSAFGRGEAQILAGTQMIAKGHDFPGVTLVGILDADLSLYLGDYRSPELTFQLVTQVAGRAGRASKEGAVIVQTYSPRHYVFRTAQNYDYKSFFDKEINSREVTKFPPYSKIIRVLAVSTDDTAVMKTVRALYDDVKQIYKSEQHRFIYLAAMKSPVKRIQSKYRYQILMRLNNNNADETINMIFELVDKHRNKQTLIFVETDPINLN